jgi:aspartyl-tRNA(Asn)/glutamyl-tRNA(Gln) amidotransferase subunit C
MRLENEYVLRVARLARLRLSPPQVETLSAQLSSVLGYMKNLEELDLSAVKPFSHAEKDGLPACTPLREDAPGASLTVKEALANAGQTEDGYFVVPRVLGEE